MRWEHRVISVEHQFFQPCSHPAASKQQMVGLDAVANLVQSYLLGSNCVLTWRELEFYSNAGKQIIVTSLASRWLYLSHVQMEFEDDKLACDAAMGCTVWFVCLLVCLSTCLSTCLYPQQLLVCCLIHQPVWFCIVADVSVLQVFISESAAEEKNIVQVNYNVHTFTLALCNRLSFNAKHCPRGQKYLIEISIVSW